MGFILPPDVYFSGNFSQTPRFQIMLLCSFIDNQMSMIKPFFIIPGSFS